MSRAFNLIVKGDKRLLLDAVLNYNWDSSAECLREKCHNSLVNSIIRDFDDDPDRVSMSVSLSSLEHLAELIKRWLPVAVELALWVSGSNNQAVFEIGLVWREGDSFILFPSLKSKLETKQGKLAEAAFEAHRVLGGAL